MRRLLIVALVIASLLLLGPLGAFAGNVFRLEGVTQVCQNGRCVPSPFMISAAMLCRTPDGKMLAISCQHPWRDEDLVSLKLGNKFRARVVINAKDCDLSLIEIDGVLEEAVPMVLPPEDISVGRQVALAGVAEDKGFKTIKGMTVSDQPAWIRDSGWPEAGKNIVVVDRSVPEGFSGGAVSHKNDDGEDVLDGIIIQTSTSPKPLTLFVPVSKVTAFLDRVVAKKVYECCWNRPQPVGAGLGLSLGPLGRIGAALGLGPQLPAIPPQRSRPNPPATVITTPTDQQVTDAVNKWLIANRESIVKSTVEAIPPQKPREPTPLPPIRVEAWEQVLDADGAPVGDPVMKSSQTYPAGSPIKILHYKTLAK